MPSTDVTIFNASADEPGGANLIITLTGAQAPARAGQITADELSNPASVLLTGASSSARAGTVAGSDTLIVEDGTNVFIDPDLGSDSNDGLFAQNAGGTNGPKATWSGVTSLDLSTKSGIYFKAGTALTGELVTVPQDFTGTSSAWNVIAAYNINTSAQVVRGAGALDRPIIQGTTTRPIDFDGTLNLNGGQHFPSFVEGSGNFHSFTPMFNLSMQPSGNPLRKNNALDRYVEVDSLHVRHTGGLGFSCDGAANIKFMNCYASFVAGQAYNLQRGNNMIVEDSYMTGCGYTDEYYGHNIGPANMFVNQSDDCILRRNVAWLNYGEVYDVGNDSDDCLVEDNVSFDTTRLHYYCSAADRAVFRRNMCFQSNKVNELADHALSGQSEAFQQYGLMAAELQHPERYRWQDGAFYSNVIIYGANPFRPGDQYRAVNGGTQHDFGSLYIFRNSIIKCERDIRTDSGGADPTASDGKYQYNLHLYPTLAGGTHDVRLVSWPTAQLKHNGWSGVLDSDTVGWTGNVQSPQTNNDSIGWDRLYQIATWNLHGGYGMDLSAAEDFITSVKAKLGTPIGNAADVSADSPPGHPTSVTHTSFDNKDFFGNTYSTNDIGAVASGV